MDAAAHIATWRALGIERATIERVGSFTRVKGRAMGIKGRFNFGFNAGGPAVGPPDPRRPLRPHARNAGLHRRGDQGRGHLVREA